MTWPPRESYAREALVRPSHEVVVGIELRDSDDIADVRLAIHTEVFRWLPNLDDLGVAREVERRVAEAFPGRYWFVEVGDRERSWVQVYQPPPRDAPGHPLA